MTSMLPAKIRTLTPSTLGGLKIEKVSQRRPHFNLMVYGGPGTGKTYLCGTSYDVSEMQRVLFIDIEGGTFTLRKDFPHVETVRVESWRQMQDVYNALMAGGHGFNTVILDSLTEIQKFNMDEIMKKLIESNDDRDMDVPSLREWGKNLEQIRRFVRAFRDLPMNVIFTALLRQDKDRMGRPINLPSLSGKMAAEVAAFLDIVLFYSLKEVEGEQVRVLQSAATESTVAKDRSGLLPPVLVNPSMNDLYDIIVRKTGEMFATTQEETKTEPEPKSTKPTKPNLEVTQEELDKLTNASKGVTSE